MVEREQVKPLAPAAYRTRSDEDEAISMELKKLRQRKYIKCCGCITALILILAVTLLILIFTLFRVKDPVIRINAVNIERLELTLPSAGLNMKVKAEVSVKNPNVASFKFSNTTTTLYYRGTAVGEGHSPPGHAKARRTLKMNVTVDIIPAKILAVPSFLSDWSSGALAMSSYTSIGGKVKILKIIKKHIVVKVNCTMTVNITSQEIQDQNCKPHVPH